MQIIAAILSAITLFFTIFSIPFDIPKSICNMLGIPLTDNETTIDKITLIKCGVFLLIFYLLSIIQGKIMQTVIPERAMALNEITQTILSGQDYNILFILFKIIFTGAFGFVSIKGFFCTIIINILYLAILTVIAYQGRFLGNHSIFRNNICIKPFNLIGVTIVAIGIFTLIYLNTQSDTESFLHIILRNLWSFADKCKIVSSIGTIVGASLPAGIAKVVITVTKTRNFGNPSPMDF